MEKNLRALWAFFPRPVLVRGQSSGSGGGVQVAVSRMLVTGARFVPAATETLVPRQVEQLGATPVQPRPESVIRGRRPAATIHWAEAIEGSSDRGHPGLAAAGRLGEPQSGWQPAPAGGCRRAGRHSCPGAAAGS
jgi:hypothetical protein